MAAHLESLFALKKPQAQREEEVLYLGFTASDQAYALPIACVREILRIPRIHTFPKVPAFVKGVVDLRGTILPVVDLRERLGTGSVDRGRGRILVLVPQNQPLGLLVDRAVEVFPVTGELMKPTPELLQRAPVPFLGGLVPHGDMLYYVMDPGLLLTPKEFEALETHAWAPPESDAPKG